MPTQKTLRYLYQCDVIIIPKSSKKACMAQNLDIRNFKLSVESMALILTLDEFNDSLNSYTNKKGLCRRHFPFFVLPL